MDRRLLRVMILDAIPLEGSCYRKGQLTMKRDVDSPEAYRRDVTGEQREMLDLIRDVVFDVAPESDEIIEYGMLGFPGLANLAAQKHYVALYVKPAVLAEHRHRFPGIDCGKSCLRFRRSEQIDPESLRDLLRAVLRARSEN
jgi:uncharacterized protein YdhG (YjbR/CyaY superfamily)